MFEKYMEVLAKFGPVVACLFMVCLGRQLDAQAINVAVTERRVQRFACPTMIKVLAGCLNPAPDRETLIYLTDEAMGAIAYDMNWDTETFLREAKVIP